MLNIDPKVESRRFHNHDSPQTNLHTDLFLFKDFMTPKHLYEVWPAKNRFLCKGRVLLGPVSDCPKLVASLTLAVFFPIVYQVLVSGFLWEVSQWLPLVTGYLHLSTIGLLLITSQTEPGIIPRKKVFEVLGGVPERFSSSVIFQEGGSGFKYCKTCQIYRPPKTHHCKVCDNCVQMFDHHCPYLGTCIGARNYLYFLILIVHAVLLLISMSVGLLVFLLHEEDHGEKSGIL